MKAEGRLEAWLGWWLFLAIFGVLVCGMPAHAVPKEPYRIIINADWSNAYPSSYGIELGIRTALMMQGGRLDGYPVEIQRLDHRANNRRHLANQKRILKDDRVLVVFGGLHSPPLLANRKFINQHGIPTLVTWAAAGPITRHGPPNWIFRLSLDDRVGGQYLIDHAHKVRGFNKPALVAEKTAWGRFNHLNMSKHMESLGMPRLQTYWYNWGVSLATAKMLLMEAAHGGADVVILVANPLESITFGRAMASLRLADRLPILSHWGGSGGNFDREVPPHLRRQFDMEIIQTRFSFTDQEISPWAKKVFDTGRILDPSAFRSRRGLRPEVAFKHAFDMTMILTAAAKQDGLTGNVVEDRRRLHHALEHLKDPVQGLIKRYERPFRPYEPEDPFAHEALSRADLVMARYDEDGALIHLHGVAPKTPDGDE